MRRARAARLTAVTLAAATLLSACGFSPYSLPLPGGADTGADPYTFTIEFRNVLDLVPKSAVKVNDLSVGKVTDVALDDWTAEVTVEVNRDVELPDNAEATIRQTSLLGEKFVSLAKPRGAPAGTLGDGDVIPLSHTDRSVEVEEVLGALSLLLNGGGLAKASTITKEVNKTLEGREPQIRSLLDNANSLMADLDENKGRILTALERVDRLAKETDKQKKAITGALDELPGALRVLDDQRDELVDLLESLHKLSDIGTETINKSKDATIKDLKLLEPILTKLTAAGDAVPRSLALLLTYPFPDALVGTTPTAARDAHLGDYNNLSVHLQLDLEQLQNLAGTGELPDVPASAVDPNVLDRFQGLLGGKKRKNEKHNGGGDENDDRVPDLPKLPRSPNVPDLPGLPDLLPKSSGVCSLVGLLCRTAPGGTTPGAATSAAADHRATVDPDTLDGDAVALMLTPVVAR